MKRVNPTHLLDEISRDADLHRTYLKACEMADKAGVPYSKERPAGYEDFERMAAIDSLRDEIRVVDLSGLSVDLSEQREVDYVGGYIPFDVVLYTNHLTDVHLGFPEGTLEAQIKPEGWRGYPQTSFLCVSKERAEGLFEDIPEVAGKWFLCIPLTWIPDPASDKNIVVHSMRVIAPVETGKWYVRSVGDASDDAAYINRMLYAVLYSFQVLECNNTYLRRERASEKLNKKRAKRGRGRIPDSYVLAITGGEQEIGVGGGGSHASPRYHFRRGHIRHLSSGKKTWVTSCMVGRSGELADKTYRVTGG